MYEIGKSIEKKSISVFMPGTHVHSEFCFCYAFLNILYRSVVNLSGLAFLYRKSVKYLFLDCVLIFMVTFFLRFYLFIHESQRKREAET